MILASFTMFELAILFSLQSASLACLASWDRQDRTFLHFFWDFKLAIIGDVQDSNFFSFEKCNFCFHLELCKLASLSLFMMSMLEILAPPLSLSKTREDPYINFHIMTKISINLICASLYIQIKTYTISITLFFMHDTKK